MPRNPPRSSLAPIIARRHRRHHRAAAAPRAAAADPAAEQRWSNSTPGSRTMGEAGCSIADAVAAHGQRAARRGDAESRPVDEDLDQAHHRASAEAERAAGGDRQRAEEHHRSRRRRSPRCRAFSTTSRRAALSAKGRMEAIIADVLPKGAYEFQYTLSNHSRPDCAIFMPD